jgi:hypothetical protein
MENEGIRVEITHDQNSLRASVGLVAALASD